VVHSGAHSFIGQVETDTEELYSNKGDFPVINNMKKAKKKKYRDSGAPPPLSRRLPCFYIKAAAPCN
jgi:hypothetical protein